MKSLHPNTIRARELRRNQMPAERALWRLLRRHQMNGFQFRRQHPIDRFFADFSCPAAKLIIEQDEVRDYHLSNSNLMRNPEGVWLEIEQFLLSQLPNFHCKSNQ